MTLNAVLCLTSQIAKRTILPMITVKNLSKAYGKGENRFQALKDVSFEIKDGASVAIIGKSGSGKSTLMHTLSGLDKADSGEISINGNDISKMRGRQVDIFRNKEMGFVFQMFFLRPYETCLENVMLPLEIAGIPVKERKAKAMSALDKVGLGDKVKSKAVNLSGGQKQRVCVARALVMEPKIIFADEPTGNLDSVTGDQIIDLLFGLNKEMKITLIMVTHDEELASKCDMQIMLKDGEITKMK